MEDRKHRLMVEPRGEVTIVTFVDKRILDESNIQDIGDQMFELVEKHYKVKLLLNFENVEYLSSAALGKLITLNKKVKAETGKLKLCNIRPQIYDVFKITKLNKLFQIYDSEDKALAAF